MKKKILFISHNASLSGAPISLSIIMRQLKVKTDWNSELLMIRKGPLLESISKEFPTQVYYKYFDYRKFRSVFSKKHIKQRKQAKPYCCSRRSKTFHGRH